MNFVKVSGMFRILSFRIVRAASSIIPGGRITAFGSGKDRIGSVLVVNLDRQPGRWKRVKRELGRFQTADGAPLTSIVQRFTAVDARDGRAVAATADVDPNYCLGNQLYVQPDARLKECFDVNEPVRMTRQEVAVARSHIEIWKAIATGSHEFVLVLEDDIWFRYGAAAAINHGWDAALRRCHVEGGPRFLYLSYDDAGGTAERADACDTIFKPVRGLWFLSGYVLSREGAAALLRAMPVVGPVDMWVNYRFEELGALALSSPAILQRQDSASDNSYSVLPYLARAGIVDAGSGDMSPDRVRSGPVLAWSAGGERESLAMALSMLGLRVRVFDGHEGHIHERELQRLFEVFDALVDPPLAQDVLPTLLAETDIKFIFEPNAALKFDIGPESMPASRTVILSHDGLTDRPWAPLCSLLGLVEPVQTFPIGAPREFRVFRDDRSEATRQSAPDSRMKNNMTDDSPWVLPPDSDWPLRPSMVHPLPLPGSSIAHATMTSPSPLFPCLVETFPGNLASFAHNAVTYDDAGANLVISESAIGIRPFRSGAFASTRYFEHGHFEAEIKAAPGPGLITGFFLHRDAPRQEIDIELAGADPRRMLANIYFNPGDDGAAMGFGYRGSPCHIDLGFDATLDFHVYAISWQPGRIMWSVDGRIVHERVGWDPTPLPYLPMRLHGNLWAPRSEKLAGRINQNALPSGATFRNISVFSTAHEAIAVSPSIHSGSPDSVNGQHPIFK